MAAGIKIFSSLEEAQAAGFKMPYLGSLEWYGPEVEPYLDALVSDERPELGAAIVKYRCFETNLRSVQPFDPDRLAPLMATCIDERRAALPRSIAALDQWLADEMRRHKTSDARALNAFFDFKRDVIYVYALGREGRESASSRARMDSSLGLRASSRRRSCSATGRCKCVDDCGASSAATAPRRSRRAVSR